MKTCYLLFLLMFCCAVTQAQTKRITGVVRDQTGDPLSGATVSGKGTTVATTTDTGGNFRIVIPEKTRTLVVSYVGREDKEVTLAGQSNIAVSMNVARSNLNEVVVIGYGTVRRKDLTGAVSSVSGKQI